ncbi:hypothetical protein VTK26DRAFT_5142 [Humicola hyalothermophila]
MAGGFDPIDPERCRHYAAFASHLNRRSFDFIYWFLFVSVIGLLFLASWKYSGDLEKARVLGLEPGSREYKRRMQRCVMFCSIYSVIAVVAVVMEVYALLALQFCDGEDLMPLYWSTWTMLQVGSVIAIFGILLAVINTLRGNKNPPWALALGTPVLVVAGIGYAVHGAMRKRVRRVRSRSRSRRRRALSISSSSRRLEPTDLPISREQTLRGAEESEKEEPPSPPVAATATAVTAAAIPAPEEINAKFLGFTPLGSPIIRFPEDCRPGSFDPDQGVVIGRSDGHVIIAFRRAMTLVDGGGGRREGGSGSDDDGGGGGSAGGDTGGGRDAGALRSRSPGPSTRSGGIPRMPPVVRIATPPAPARGGDSLV